MSSKSSNCINFELAGKLSPAPRPEEVCVVTGGARGIGRAICDRLASEGALGKGKMESALMRSLQIVCFLTEGLFGVLPLTCFYLPSLSKLIAFAAAPLVLIPFVRDLRV